MPVTFKHEHPNGEVTLQEWSGLSLRDWFAGQALVGMYLADELSRFLVGKEDRTRPLRTTDTEFATSAYQQADAMLRARAALAEIRGGK